MVGSNIWIASIWGETCYATAIGNEVFEQKSALYKKVKKGLDLLL